jgi:hypothetical protein
MTMLKTIFTRTRNLHFRIEDKINENYLNPIRLKAPRPAPFTNAAT